MDQAGRETVGAGAYDFVLAMVSDNRLIHRSRNGCRKSLNNRSRSLRIHPGACCMTAQKKSTKQERQTTDTQRRRGNGKATKPTEPAKPVNGTGTAALRIFRTLMTEYPQTRCALTFSNPMETLVATVLSAQCTDKRVNLVTPGLFKKYPDVNAYADAGREELEQDIHSTGFFRQKAKNIIASARIIRDEHGGKVPDSMEKLTELPGIGRKTANIILSNAYGRIEGIAVDTHVRRLSQRLELSAFDDPNKIERDLMALLPKKDWPTMSHLLIDHGRAVCHSRKPGCEGCVLREKCPYPESCK